MADDLNSLLVAAVPMLHGLLGAEAIELTEPLELIAVTSSRVPESLVMAASALAGATAISLRLADSSTLSGLLGKGSVLTIGGADYVVQSGVAVAGDVITAVPVAPALAADVAEDDVVAVKGPTRRFEDCFCQNATEVEMARFAAGATTLLVSVPKRNAPTTPRQNMGFRRLKDGAVGRVSGFAATEGGSWDLEVGRP